MRDTHTHMQTYTDTHTHTHRHSAFEKFMDHSCKNRQTDTESKQLHSSQHMQTNIHTQSDTHTHALSNHTQQRKVIGGKMNKIVFLI